MSSGGIVINEGSNDRDVRIEGNGDANAFFLDGSVDRIYFGRGVDTDVNGFNGRLQLSGTDFDTSGMSMIRYSDSTPGPSLVFAKSRNATLGSNTIVQNGDQLGKIRFTGADGVDFGNTAGEIQCFVNGTPGENDMPGGLAFSVAADSATGVTEQVRIVDGTLMIGCTTATPGVSNTTDGLSINTNGRLFSNAAANGFSQFATDSDGNILSFASAGAGEGTISISGSTTTYGAFTGTHWSRLADNSKPTILRGTLMESLDEMCDWYQAVADVAEVKYTAEDEEVKSGSKNVGDVKEAAYKKRVPITLPDGKAVGDAVTFTYEGETHTGVYEKETDIKHVKCKISDTADSKKIYGLFSHWDSGFDYLDDDVNDMNIAQVGTFVIRVNKDVTVEAGDLLVSNGDGTAKKQDDDIIRSKTVAKVNSNIKVETYEDGSYTVPCTLHC
jgi:plastocyanin